MKMYSINIKIRGLNETEWESYHPPIANHKSITQMAATLRFNNAVIGL